MSDNAQVETLDEGALVDLFGGNNVQTSQKSGVTFGSEEIKIDLLNMNQLATPATPATPVAGTEGVKEDEGKEGENKDVKPVAAVEGVKDNDDPGTQADILDTPSKAGRKPKYDFSDMSGYFQDRVKNKKFIAIDEEDAQGNKVQFVPKTPEEFDEAIDLQINYRLEQERKQLSQRVYEGKSPAWKAALQFAELVDDPSQMIPFLQGVKNINSIKDINPEEIEGAETIVRNRMEQRGDPDDVIDNQIESLKTTDKLIATAKQFKPIMLQQEQQSLAQQVQEEKRREQEYLQVVSTIRESAVKAIEQPMFGKTKLKQEEKAAIYDLIAEPTPETQGYGIYNAIDQLFDKGDFDTLRQIALLVAKKDAFFGYVNASAAQSVAAGLQKKLTVAGESRTSSGNDYSDTDPDNPVIQRNQYAKQQPRFGRG